MSPVHLARRCVERPCGQPRRRAWQRAPPRRRTTLRRVHGPSESHVQPRAAATRLSMMKIAGWRSALAVRECSGSCLLSLLLSSLHTLILITHAATNRRAGTPASPNGPMCKSCRRYRRSLRYRHRLDHSAPPDPRRPTIGLPRVGTSPGGRLETLLKPRRRIGRFNLRHTALRGPAEGALRHARNGRSPRHLLCCIPAYRLTCPA